jgi:hypothetical protein
VDCWRDIAWDGEPMIDHLKKVHSVLVTASPLDFVKLRNLFGSGDTVMLMGDAMQFLDNGVDNGVDILREIIVVDYTHKNVTIRHEDISF